MISRLAYRNFERDYDMLYFCIQRFILAGRHANLFHKTCGKITPVTESKRIADFLYTLTAVNEQKLRLSDFFI